MIVNKFARLARLHAPADDGGGGGVDFGDDLAVDDDTVDGGDGDDTVKGANVDDTVKGGDADDTAKGGDGDDTIKGADADDKNKKKDTRIPLARHKELLAKEREGREDLERQLAKFQGGATIAATNEKITTDEKELVKLDAEYSKLVTDGEHAKASETMSKIRLLERGISDAKLQLTTQAAEARAYERVRYDTTVERLEEAFPVINPDHDDFDEVKTAEVLELKEAYQSKGYAPAAALQRAVKMLLKPTTQKQDAATEVQVRVDKDAVKDQVNKDRKEKAVAKNVDTAKKQPASQAGVGADSDKAGGGIVDAKAVLRMKYDDFVKLDEAALSKLRGDDL